MSKIILSTFSILLGIGIGGTGISLMNKNEDKRLLSECIKENADLEAFSQLVMNEFQEELTKKESTRVLEQVKPKFSILIGTFSTKHFLDQMLMKAEEDNIKVITFKVQKGSQELTAIKTVGYSRKEALDLKDRMLELKYPKDMVLIKEKK